MSDLICGILYALVMFALIFGVVILGLRAKDKIVLLLFSERIRAREKQRRERFLYPQAEAVEEILGKKLPERLLAMYQDLETVQQEHFSLDIPGEGKRWMGGPGVTKFLPLLPESIVIPSADLGLGTGFCFAVNGKNIFYCIGITQERAKDMPVYMVAYVASSWVTDNIAKSLQEFLSWRRVPRKWLRMT